MLRENIVLSRDTLRYAFRVYSAGMRSISTSREHDLILANACPEGLHPLYLLSDLHGENLPRLTSEPGKRHSRLFDCLYSMVSNASYEQSEIYSPGIRHLVCRSVTLRIRSIALRNFRVGYSKQ